MASFHGASLLGYWAVELEPVASSEPGVLCSQENLINYFLTQREQQPCILGEAAGSIIQFFFLQNPEIYVWIKFYTINTGST